VRAPLLYKPPPKKRGVESVKFSRKAFINLPVWGSQGVITLSFVHAKAFNRDARSRADASIDFGADLRYFPAWPNSFPNID
jgi:hypothetical protein